jgi:plastocyanin
LSGQTTPLGVWVAIGISLAALIFAMAVYTEVATMNTVQVPADLTQQLNNLQSMIGSMPAVNQTPTTRNLLVEWAMDAAGLDSFSPNLLVVNQGDNVSVTFISNDTGDAHTFTLISGTYNFQINLTANGLANSLTGETFTTPPTNNSPSVTITGSAGNLAGVGSFVATTPGVYKFVCVYHRYMYGFLVVLPNSAYSG